MHQAFFGHYYTFYNTHLTIRHVNNTLLSILVGIILLQDGTLCTGGLDKIVRLWNWSTGLQLRAFAGHTDSVFTVLELPGPGSLICSGSADRTIRIWNRNSGNPNLSCVRTLTGLKI